MVGHDWGASIAWECARTRPDVFRAVAAMSVPLPVRPPAPPTAILAKRFPGSFFYMLYFQELDRPEAELEADPRRSLRLIYYAASGEAQTPGQGFAFKSPGSGLLEGMVDTPVLPPWLTEHDLDVLESAFRRSGFRGPLNRYRAMDLDWAEGEKAPESPVTQPALFIAGDRDMTVILAKNALDRMQERVPQLRRTLMIPGAGHWIGEERPREVNDALVAFLRQL